MQTESAHRSQTLVLALIHKLEFVRDVTKVIHLIRKINVFFQWNPVLTQAAQNSKMKNVSHVQEDFISQEMEHVPFLLHNAKALILALKDA